MGQQQLLLIVLGVIIVGIAVVVGINLFNANAEESAKDTLVSEGTNIGAMAQQYYKKPGALGGGGNSFDGSRSGTPSVPAFAVPDRLDTSSVGGTWLAAPNADNCTITFTPDAAQWQYTFTGVIVTVTPTSISSAIQGL
jgi:hypothetical protein